jgi:hypothetical protein
MNKYCIFLTKGYYEYYAGKMFYDKKLGIYYPLTTQDIDDKEVKWYKNRQTANSINEYGFLDTS